MRDEAIIPRIAHGGVKEAVHHQRARGLVELIFDGFAADRDFDDDIDVIRGILADGNLVYAHEEILQFCGRGNFMALPRHPWRQVPDETPQGSWRNAIPPVRSGLRSK